MIEWLANNALSAAALGIVVALYCRFGKPSASTRHLLWLTVIVTLLMPRWVNWPWSIELSHPTHPTAKTDHAALDQSHGLAPAGHDNALHQHAVDLVEWIKHHGQIEQTSPPSTSGELTYIVPEGEAPAASLDEAASSSIDAIRIGASIWLAGSAAMLAWLMMQIACAARLVAGGRRAPRRLIEEVAAAARSMGVAPPRIVIVRRAVSPAVVCLGTPVLIWPRWINRRLGAEERAAILRHELAHLRRRDHWVGWLSAVAACLWWPHPIYWIARRQVLESAELAADAYAASTDRHDRRRYAQALITVVERVARTTGPLAPVGAAGASRRLLERRLQMVMNGTGSARLSRPAALGALLLAAAAAPGWAQFSPDQIPAADAAPPAVAPAPPSPANLPAPAPVAQPAPAPRPFPQPSADVLYFTQAQPAPTPVPVAAPSSAEHIEQLQRQIDALAAQLAELRRLNTATRHLERHDLPNLDENTRARIEAQAHLQAVQAAQQAVQAARIADVQQLAEAHAAEAQRIQREIEVQLDQNTDVQLDHLRQLEVNTVEPLDVNVEADVNIESDDEFDPVHIRIEGHGLTDEQVHEIEARIQKATIEARAAARAGARAARERASADRDQMIRVQGTRALLDAGLQPPQAEVPAPPVHPVHPVHPVGPVHLVQPPQPASPDQAPRAVIQLTQPRQPPQPGTIRELIATPRSVDRVNPGGQPRVAPVPTAPQAGLFGGDVIVQTAPEVGTMVTRFHEMPAHQAKQFAEYLGQSALPRQHPISIRVLGGEGDPGVRLPDGPREGLMVTTTEAGQQAITFAIDMLRWQAQQRATGTAPAPAPAAPIAP